ncbi:DNA cytosine methyltransferase [Pannus brasiliensis]|uniref:DNA cytosine methyltransferase n=1 Tax=Pannus brasiliensis TaxID=1579216 RepID=UPI003BEEBA3E
MSDQLNELDLYSGDGCGFPLAGVLTERIKLRFAADNNPNCQTILGLRYPDAEIAGDVYEFRWKDYYKRNPGGTRERIDLVTASPPCQPFSLQGDRKGVDDPRDGIPGLLTVLKTLKPRYLAFENVPGLLSCPFKPGDEPGSYFRKFVESLAKFGFDAQWMCIGSWAFGSPFFRQRLLLVAVSRSAVRPGWEKVSWAEQARSASERYRNSGIERSFEPPISREKLQSAFELDEPIGIPSGDATVKQRRSALGNSLDWRVAKCALDRILWIHDNYGI